MHNTHLNIFVFVLAIGATAFPDDDSLLFWARRAKRGVKIFIYPKIPDPTYPTYHSFASYNASAHECNPHFLMERKFPEYIRNTIVETTNPRRADFFLIDHDYSCFFSTNVNNSLGKRLEHEFSEKYLTAVMANVVQNFPYYNKSGGLDHLMVFTLDRGRCEMALHPGLHDIIPYYEPVTFIGNFGFAQEDISFETMQFGKFAFSTGRTVTRRLPRCTLFGSGRNIVIPQFHEWVPEPYDRRLRRYHSVFVGRVKRGGLSGVNVRPILLNIHAIGFPGFYASDLSNASLSSITLRDSYFSLCPGGAAPWSVRMYDAIYHHSIPVILADGIVLPFEKFLDWKSFTVKQSSDYVSVQDGVELLKQLRKHAANAMRNKITTLKYSKSDITKTFIHTKLENAVGVMPWLSWNEASPRSAYGLLMLELWCRKFGYVAPICRPMMVNSSEIAYLEYW